MNTLLWNPTGYYVLGSVLCILAQLIIILILLAQQRRGTREIKALRASERMYRLLTENAEDVISRHTADGRIKYVSPVCLDIFGYTPDEIFHQGITPFIHPDDLDNSWNVVHEAVAAGNEHYALRQRLKHKQGHWVWVEIRGRLLYDSTGELAEIHCLTRDITDHKQAEDTLKASEEKIRTLFGLVPVGISVSSLKEGRFFEVNEAFVQTLGYRRDEAIGKTSRELNVLTTPAGREQFLAPLRQHGSVRNIEVDLRAKSGVVLNTLFSCEAVNIGGQQCLIAAFIDITQRKRNEVALRESEATFRTIFENAPVTMAISRTEDGTYLDVNQKFVKSSGFSKEDIIGKKPSDGLIDFLEESDSNPFTPSEHVPALQKSGHYLTLTDFKYIEQEFRTCGKLENFYFRSITRKGEIVHNLMSAYPLTLHGELCALTIITDITELKEAEEDLREREEKYRVLFENMAQGAMYQLADGRIEDVNAAALAIFDMSYDEFIAQTSQGNPLWKIVHEDGLELPVEQWPIAVALTTGQPVRNMTIRVHLPQKPDGVWVTITVIPQFRPDDTRPYRVFTTFHDITDLKQIEQELRAHQEHLEELVEERTSELQHEVEFRKHTERSLRESEGKYRLIAENATDVIGIQNSARQFTYISPSVHQLVGYTPEELIQGIPGELFTQGSRKMMAGIIARNREDDPAPTRLEIELIRKDGATMWAEVIVKRLYDTMGQHIGFLGIARDISDRKQAEAALQQAKESAETANRAKSMFLSNMSHELRTPLNAILGFAQLLARETTLSSVQQEYLETINRGGEHLLQLINDVLDISKIEAGRISMNCSSFDLVQMLANIEEMMRVRAEQKGVEFSVELPSDMPRYIRTDEKKLRQILINMVGNAVKFTEHGNVRLKIGAFSESEHVPTHQFWCEISDTGPGIAPEDLSAIFEAFRQTSRVHDNEGTGLGLAISRTLVQLLGGDMQVKSDVGRGSCFSFNIQVELVEDDNAVPVTFTRTITGLASPQVPVRILVVDDHAESRHLVTLLLGDVGFDIREATNGREALTVMEQWSPHLILMDMIMPVMDGYESTRAIRKLERAHLKDPLPIIALTASVFDEEQQHILAAGCTMLLRKPISAPELFEAIQAYLGVEYIYADDEWLPDVHRPKSHVSALTPDALATLPDAVLENLKQAVISGNQMLMTQAVAAIQEHRPELADSIIHLVQNFKYQAIWKMIQQIRPTERNDA